MKIKKFILGIVAAILFAATFTGCFGKDADPSKEAPKLVSIKAYNIFDQEIDFAIGGTVDASKIYYLELKFNKDMDTNYGGWWNWQTYNHISTFFYNGVQYTQAFWINSRNFHFYFDVPYTQRCFIDLSINPASALAQYGNQYFWRDNYGNFLDEVPISFSTTVATDYPKIAKIEAFDKDDNPIAFENNGTSISQKIEHIDITFDRPMRKQGSFVYYGGNNYSTGYEWMNQHTWRLHVKMGYENTYIFCLNDRNYYYSEDNFLPRNSWFCDTNGNCLEELYITFTTEKSSMIHPHTFEFDINEFIAEDLLIDLSRNQYAENYQVGQSIYELFWPEKLNVGDTVKLKYKIRSDFDLPEILVNLVDISESVGYWNVLSTKETADVPLSKETVKASTEKNPVYYENEITFDISSDMTDTCTIQFTSWDLTHKNPYQFWIPSTKGIN